MADESYADEIEESTTELFITNLRQCPICKGQPEVSTVERKDGKKMIIIECASNSMDQMHFVSVCADTVDAAAKVWNGE